MCGRLFWVVSNVRPFLRFTGRADLVEAAGLAGVKRSHRIRPVLGDDDPARVVHACSSGLVNARDAAITLRALTTGLRACDITGLRLGQIRWRAQALGIIQQKTHNPLTLPLPALVTTKLADHVLGGTTRRGRRSRVPTLEGPTHPAGRPRLDLPGDRRGVPVFRRAGVSEVNAGTRLLRHSAASRLLRAAVPLLTISAVLGHSDPESTNLYLSMD